MAKLPPITIRYKKLVPEAKTPYRKIDVDAGFDLYAVSKKETPKYVVYYTGIAFEIPVGYVGLVFPRSSVTEYDLMLKNCVGVIDASYRGEIMCRFFGTHALKYKIGNNEAIIYGDDVYKIGERVVQVVFLKLPDVQLIEVDELSETERGSQGFGHTGK
jgi:dUTP pyrophosphatase